MKHLSGEKTGLKAGLLKNSFILFFLFFTLPSFSQIPLNGFCFEKSYILPKGFQSLIASDLNKDGQDEIIFYSSQLKRIGIYSGIVNDQIQISEFPIRSEISQIKRINNVSDGQNLFAVVERKLRKVSVLYLSVDSLAERLAEIEFDSYPENISVADIDLNGTDEVLISGSGFDGLSILFRAEDGIGEKKIISGTSFSESIFIDLNDDGYQDVLAFNILENSLQFFLNNTNGDFRNSRSISYIEQIFSLKSIDINNDGIQDIVYVKGNKIEFLVGDVQSTYRKKSSIQLEQKPEFFQFGNFNGDKFLDIAYSIPKNKLNILFGKNELEFYEGITYLKNSSLISFTKFRNGLKDNIACLTEDAKLLIFNSKNSFNSDMKISVGIQSGALKKFDYASDGIPDISFVDEYDNTLKLLINDESGIGSRLYIVPLADNHQEILVDEFFRFRKIFYCFSKGLPLLEIFRYNLSTDKLIRKQLYAPGEILDVAFQREDSTLVNIFVIYNKQSKLYLGKFENRELSVTFREYPFIDRNVIAAEMFIQEDPEIFYWKNDQNLLEFKKALIKSGPNEEKTFYEISESDNYSVNLYASDKYNDQYPAVVSVIYNADGYHLLTVSGDQFYISNQISDPEIKEKKEFAGGYFGETSIKGLINFTVNSTDDNYIYKLVFDEKEKTYSLRPMFAAENLSDYFFARLDRKNYYLIYSEKKEGRISIKSLKK